MRKIWIYAVVSAAFSGMVCQVMGQAPQSQPLSAPMAMGPANHGSWQANPHMPFHRPISKGVPWGIFDTNRDGEIGPDEIHDSAKTLNGLDKNQDGKLTPDEFLSVQGPPTKNVAPQAKGKNHHKTQPDVAYGAAKRRNRKPTKYTKQSFPNARPRGGFAGPHGGMRRLHPSMMHRDWGHRGFGGGAAGIPGSGIMAPRFHSQSPQGPGGHPTFSPLGPRPMPTAPWGAFQNGTPLGPAPHGPAPHGPAPHGPAPHGPAPHGPAPHGPAPHGPAPHGPAPHGPAPHGPAPHGPAPHGPAPHGPAPHGPAAHGPAAHGPAAHGPAAHRGDETHVSGREGGTTPGGPMSPQPPEAMVEQAMRFDQNHDGQLDRNELLELARQMHGPRSGQPQDRRAEALPDSQPADVPRGLERQRPEGSRRPEVTRNSDRPTRAGGDSREPQSRDGSNRGSEREENSRGGARRGESTGSFEERPSTAPDVSFSLPASPVHGIGLKVFQQQS